MNLITKNIKSVVFVVCSLVLIVSGSIMYFTAQDAGMAPGIYFRRHYGFVSFRQGEVDTRASIGLHFFNVGNQDIDFLKDANGLSFGVEGIDIVDVVIERGNRLRAIEVLRLNLTAIMSVDFVSLTSLISSQTVHQFGVLNVQQAQSYSRIISSNINSSFIFVDEGALFSFGFGNQNSVSFSIEEFIFHHDYIYSYNFGNRVFPINYAAGSSLSIDIWFEFDIGLFDIFLLSPIVRLIVEGQEEHSYFVPLMSTIHEVPMTYFDIREYFDA